MAEIDLYLQIVVWRQSMLRTPVAICGGALSLVIVAARADELPMHKAGYWEMKTAMGPISDLSQ